MTTCDALIVGGGPAGATAALLLARAGRRVMVVEKAQFPRRKVCGEFISATTWPLLERLGVARELLALAGPPVRRVGVFVGSTRIAAQLPDPNLEYPGHALGREHLDAVLLASAAGAGAEVRQPWTLERCDARGDDCECVMVERGTGRSQAIAARLVIAAHGAWEAGVLPTQQWPRPARDADLLGFKAHFTRTSLPSDLMPLLAFPGGYGGMVHSDSGRMSLSCCIRRDALKALRVEHRELAAGPALLAGIVAACDGAADALRGAALQGAWLAAGPLHTGIRSFGTGHIVAIGNAAAEAHPIVAEGISMAIQSAQLLCEALTADDGAWSSERIAAVRRAYARSWRRNFSRRLHAAAIFAHLFMRPLTARLAARTLQTLPRLLTIGAHWSGKDALLHSAEG